jgi:hypothetical protein
MARLTVDSWILRSQAISRSLMGARAPELILKNSFCLLIMALGDFFYSHSAAVDGADNPHAWESFRFMYCLASISLSASLRYPRFTVMLALYCPLKEHSREPLFSKTVMSGIMYAVFSSPKEAAGRGLMCG